MKQIHLIHVVQSSSRHSWLERLISELESQGFSQSLVTLHPRGDINNFLEGGSVNVFSQLTSNKARSIVGAINSIKKAQKSGSINFLLVEGHSAAYVGALAGRYLNLDFGIVHHNQPKYFQILREKNPIRGSIHQRIYNFYIKRASIIQSLSREVTDSLLTLGCDVRKIVSVGHGVDFVKFENDLTDKAPQLKLREGFPRILMVGRLALEKNYFLAIESFGFLRQAFPTAQLLIAGTGPLKVDIESLVLQKGLTDNVSILGWVKNIPQLMVVSDALLHLSMTESYGQVYIEACLANLPIFSFPTGIAIDLFQAENPLVHIISDESPKEINSQIKDFFTERVNDSKTKAPVFNEYRRHDQTVVFQEMADYLSKVIPKLR